MPVPPYTITFQPSSSGTTLVSRVIVPRPLGASGVHKGPMIPVLKTYQSLGGPDRISTQKAITNSPCHDSTSPGITNTPVHLSHIPAKVTLARDAQVAPLRQDLPQRLVVGSCPIDSTLTTHPKHTPRSPHFHYPVFNEFMAPHALHTYISPSPASHHRYNASKSKVVSM
jgi:hypothetical protein